MSCAPPELTEVNETDYSIIPLPDTAVNQPTSTSRLQQWFVLVKVIGMHLFYAVMLILSLHRLDSAIFNLVNMFSTMFSWSKLGSAVFKIISALRRLVKIFGKYSSQPFRRNNSQAISGSVTEKSKIIKV